MSKLIPRKIKKACKAYRSNAPLIIKTKWLRYVRNQIVTGRIDVTDDFTTRYGSLIVEYIDYEKFYKLLTYIRTTVYPSVKIYLLIAYFNWDIYWIEKQSNVFSRYCFCSYPIACLVGI